MIHNVSQQPKASVLDRALYSSEQMNEVDALCAPYISTDELMENAGWAVARSIRKHYEPMKTLVLCGPGNNGGDGYVTARYLKEAGWPVGICYMKPPKQGSLSEKMAKLFDGPILPFSGDEVRKVSLVVDALFGAGLSRDIGDSIAQILQQASRIVSIDVPTGVDGTSGCIRGYAPHAELTVTFCRLKPGHLLYPAKEYLGEVELADIKTPLTVLEKKWPTIWHNDPLLWKVPSPQAQSNKYTRGVVSVCSGASMPGAALLASSAARAAGAGLVCLLRPSHDHLSNFSYPPGLVINNNDDLASLLADHRRKTWVCGPGLSPGEVQTYLPKLIAAKRLIVADAGVFSAYAGKPEKLKGVSVITPHVGEFKRLFSIEGRILPEMVIEGAKRTQAITILKGASTIIAAPDGTYCINTHATAKLATAGSGDTLTGIIAALLATGMSPWESACAGVWIHGEASYLSGDWPVAEDFDRYIGQARNRASLERENEQRYFSS